MSKERQTYSVPCVRCPLAGLKPVFVADCKECSFYKGMKVTTEGTVIECEGKFLGD